MLIKKVLAYIILLSGIVLLYSVSMPTYTNEVYKQALDDRGMKAMRNNEFQGFQDYYYKKLEDLKTNRPQVMDISFGLLIASVTVYCFMLNSKIRKYHNLKAVKTLKSSSLLLLSNFMWLMLIPGVYWHYLFRSGRGDYPWFVDDISIPLGSKIPPILIGWLLMNVFVMYFLGEGRFPAHLFTEQPRDYSHRRAWDAFWGTLIVINTLFLGWLIKDGDHISIIVDLYLTYLLLSLRAGKIHAVKIELAKHAENQQLPDDATAAQ